VSLIEKGLEVIQDLFHNLTNQKN